MSKGHSGGYEEHALSQTPRRGREAACEAIYGDGPDRAEPQVWEAREAGAADGSGCDLGGKKGTKDPSELRTGTLGG